jgi:hypothetical protein
MKPDLYTKVVLTAIALALVRIACNQYVHPATTAQAHGAYAGVQFAGQGDNLWFFDSRTGDVYKVLPLRSVRTLEGEQTWAGPRR